MCLAHRGMFVGAINIRRKLDDTGVLTRAAGERESQGFDVLAASRPLTPALCYLFVCWVRLHNIHRSLPILLCCCTPPTHSHKRTPHILSVLHSQLTGSAWHQITGHSLGAGLASCLAVRACSLWLRESETF